MKFCFKKCLLRGKKMVKAKVNKVSIVVNNYTTAKTEQKKDLILNGYVFERQKLFYGYDRQADQRKTEFKELEFKDQYKKYRILSIFASKISERLKKEILSSKDFEQFLDALLMKELNISEKQIIDYYK